MGFDLGIGLKACLCLTALIYSLLYIIYGFLFQEFKQEIEHEFYTRMRLLSDISSPLYTNH